MSRKNASERRKRLLAAGLDILKNESEAALNERSIDLIAESGEKGLKGDKGEKGERGEKGEKGDRGLQGQPGIPGNDGKPGRPGIDGKTGKPGDKGDKGDAGEKGSDGDGFKWKGRWHSTQTYLKGDVVEFGGSSLVALKKTKERPDARAVNWEMLAAHGASGLTGAKGADGVGGPGGSGAWGAITGTLSDQTDLQAALNAKANSLGSDDNYVTDAEKVKLGNLSGTNTGDETAAGILTKLLTVDGPGSGLDADTLDGINGATLVASIAAKLDAAGVTGFSYGLFAGVDAAAWRTELGVPNSDIRGVDVLLDGVLIEGSSPGLEFAGSDFALSINSDGSVNITNKRPKKAFSGALVRKSADLTATNFTTIVAVAWNTETYDYDGWHDNVTNNSRLTVPAGVTKIKLAACIAYANMTADTWAFLGFRKNGSATYDGNASHQTETGATSGFCTTSSPVLEVVPGDYFELFYQVESDTSTDITAARSWFSIEAVE